MQKQENIINSRIYFLYTVLSIAFIIAALRVTYLQTYKHQELKEKADKQQRRPMSLAKKRGTITDRNNSILAIDTDSISVYSYAPEYDFKNYTINKISKELSSVIDIDKEELRKKISNPGFTWIKRQMDVKYKQALDKIDIPGINYVYESKRVYPKKNLAASLLGFTGIDNTGLAGIEISFDSVLIDKNNEEKIFLDGMGREVIGKNKTQVTTKKVKTNTIKLSLDEKIQHVSERELKKGVIEYKAKKGLAAVMDLETGDLLSFATYPTYDPNNPTGNWNVINNWGVSEIYEPGSTMKIFSIAAALEKKKITLNELVPCPAAMMVGGWEVHDHGADGTRHLTPLDIIKVSSNTGTSIVTRRIPPKEHRDLLEKFGFGKTTDSNLTGEIGGILPDLPWDQVRQSTISFGQGVSVTPIQILTAMSAIARGGVKIEPRIIKEIVDIDGNTIKEYKSKEVRTLSKDVADKMRNLMVAVVEDKEGTGRATKIPGYVIAGKTGTADKVENGRYSGNVMSSFLGFYPAEKPKILQFVLLDSPQTAHFASMTAVPIYKRIASDTIKILKIPPTKPEELIEKKNKP
ncbi:MAG: penicillin-binding protein 2 [Candidatus Sericytochromatia bacterium]